MSDITSMHDTVPYSAVKDMHPHPFGRVTVTHMTGDTNNQKEANQERSPSNVVQVTMRLPDGGYLTVWPNGIMQVSNSHSVNSVNYQVDTASGEITRAYTQPEPTEDEGKDYPYDNDNDDYY